MEVLCISEGPVENRNTQYFHRKGCQQGIGSTGEERARGAKPSRGWRGQPEGWTDKGRGCCYL